MIPERTRQGLDDYVRYGECGGFLEAALVNCLSEAVFTADDENLAALPDIVRYVYNELPAACWGSEEKVDAWRSARRAERITSAEYRAASERLRAARESAATDAEAPS